MGEFREAKRKNILAKADSRMAQAVEFLSQLNTTLASVTEELDKVRDQSTAEEVTALNAEVATEAAQYYADARTNLLGAMNRFAGARGWTLADLLVDIGEGSVVKS